MKTAREPNRKNLIVRIILLLLITLSVSTASTVRTYEQRVGDYLQAIENAKQKVRKFKEAMVSGDPAKIKKETLEIQKDPVAIKELNKESNFVKKKFVETTESIQAKTIENIKKKFAKQYNAKHPEAKISVKDVDVKKFTNPNSEIKAGHDWDVTVTVKGKDVPYLESEGVVHKSYYEAAGGKKVYPDSSPEEFAKSHHVEVTSHQHAEAYEGGMDYINNTKDYKVKDPERLSKTIEHKSHLDQKNAAEHADKGEYAKSEVYKHEQARQYTKQYEKHIEPRIKEMGGRVPENVRKGTEILKKIGKYDPKLKRVYTPADADSALAKLGKHGETMESIIKKGSALVESGQKIKPSETIKSKIGRNLGEYMDGAVIMGQAQKVREGIKEGDTTKVKSAFLGEDTANRSEGGKKYNSDMDKYDSAKKEEVISVLTNKLKRMGATKEEIESFRNNYGKDTHKIVKIIEDVKSRGGKDTAVRRPLDANAKMDDEMTKSTRAIEAAKQAGSYGKVLLDMLSMGGVTRGDASKKDLSDTGKQSDRVFTETENTVIGKLYTELRDRGASKEEAREALENYRNDKSGVRKLVADLKERDPQKAKGSGRKRDGLSVDNVIISKDDDGWLTRIEETFKKAAKSTKEMLYDEPKKLVVETAQDLSGEEGKKYNSDMDTYESAKEEEVLSALTHKLKRMGATKEEIESFRDNYGKDRHKIAKIIKDVKSRGGKDAAKHRALDTDGKMDDEKKSDIEKYIEEKRRELREQYDHKKEKLLELGATELEAAKALAGKQGSVAKLVKDLKEKQQQEKEEKAARKKELAEKVKVLMAQTEAEEREAEAEAARKRLEDKIAQSKKEELSEKAKALTAQAKKSDRELEIKTAKQKNKEKRYEEMTIEERHKALKENSDEAWKGLEQDIVSGSPKKIERTIESLSGFKEVKSPWSGKFAMEIHSRGEFFRSPVQIDLRFIVSVVQNANRLKGNVAMRGMSEKSETKMVASLSGLVNGNSADITVVNLDDDEGNGPTKVVAKLSSDANSISVVMDHKRYSFRRVTQSSEEKQ